MAADQDKPRNMTDRPLELTMRDTLENLQELALKAGSGASLGGGLEILAIVPPDQYEPDPPGTVPEEPDNIVTHPVTQTRERE